MNLLNGFTDAGLANLTNAASDMENDGSPALEVEIIGPSLTGIKNGGCPDNNQCEKISKKTESAKFGGRPASFEAG